MAKRTFKLVAGLVLGLVAFVLAATPSSAVQQGPADREISTRSKKIDTCNIPGQEVQITFDDAGTPQQVKGILRVLRKQNVRAMFFPGGYFAQFNPRLIGKITRQGHLLGNHTYGHEDLTRLSNNRIRSEITRGVQGTTSPMLLRAPYGAGSFDPRIQRIAGSMGYQLCDWTVDTRDWEGASAHQIVSRVQSVQKNGVILMHLQAPHTVKALPGVIQAVLDKGLRLPRLVG